MTRHAESSSEANGSNGSADVAHPGAVEFVPEVPTTPDATPIIPALLPRRPRWISRAIDPGEPGPEALQPDDAEEPLRALQPADAEEPVRAAVEPDDAEERVQALQPAEPEEPADAEKPVQALQPAKPEKPADVVEEPVQGLEPAELEEPAEAEGSVQAWPAAEPEELVQPADSEEPVRAVQPRELPSHAMPTRDRAEWCTIVLVHTGRHGEFRVVARQGGVQRVLETSEPFSLPRSLRIRERGQARAAHDALVKQLLESGWKPLEARGRWHDTAFVRHI